MKRRLLFFSILILLLLAIPGRALAQDYYFQLPQLIVHVFWNEDGTQSLDYMFVFHNDPSGHAIEYVDVGLPNSNFVESSIRADVNGQPVSDISSSGFQGEGSDGVAVGLGALSIPPGKSGRVHVFVGTVRRVLYPDEDGSYISAVFSPAYFISDVVSGSTDMTVIFHLPPGVQPNEPRWHKSPSGWPSQPETGFDDQGRITYTWHNPKANAYTQYFFGASFPPQYAPETAVVRQTIGDKIAKAIASMLTCIVPLAFFAAIGVIIYIAATADRRRKLQYLPPKISIEGHGIKRGLTAVEAAILLEQPMDKILTMILFGLIKKNAAQVVKRDPLEIEPIEPTPTDLQSYENDFLEAFKKTKSDPRRRVLQAMMISLVQSVSQKMKGFSRRESVAYYRDITQKAWAQVEAAQTPEVKSEKYDEVMEWTMLDRDYEDRTRRVFTGPVFVPMWWGRYDPAYGRSVIRPTAPVSTPSGRSGSPSLPHLPGSDFAASMVRGVQSFSAGVVGNLTDFTSGVTKVTNPPPPPSTSSSRGGRSSGSGCACACACAGCACACAGGGR